VLITAALAAPDGDLGHRVGRGATKIADLLGDKADRVGVDAHLTWLMSTSSSCAPSRLDPCGCASILPIV
jgi:hypothetical protein